MAEEAKPGAEAKIEVPEGQVLTPPMESFNPIDVVIERHGDSYVLRYVTPFKIYVVQVSKEDGHAMSRILSPLYVSPEDSVPVL